MKVHLLKKNPKNAPVWECERVYCGANFHPMDDEESSTSKRKNATCKKCLQVHGKLIAEKAKLSV